jgi:predicted nicotinamide N-methyase
MAQCLMCIVRQIKKNAMETDCHEASPEKQWTRADGILTVGGDSNHCSRIVWNAAVCLLRFLEQWMLDSPRGITNVLELGSGTGWLGMTLARNLSSLRMVLTEPDLFGCLDFLRRNLEANLNAGLVDAARVSCLPFDWSDASASILLERWDLVLGSDLIYNSATVQLLPPVLATLVQSGSRILYCQTLYRWGAFGWDLPFYDALCAAGLSCLVLWLEPKPERDETACKMQRGTQVPPRPRDLDCRACVVEIIAAPEKKCNSEVRALFARAHERKREQDAWLSATSEVGELEQIEFVTNMFEDDWDAKVQSR